MDVYYKANLDSSGKALLEGKWFRVWDGYGYYYMTSVCMRVKSDGTENELFMGGKWVREEN
jgi:hypothetical protein